MMRTHIIGLIVDNLLSDLSTTTKNKSYCRKEHRKLIKKHHRLGANNATYLNDVYKVANKAWLDAQKNVAKAHKNGLEYSTVYVMKQLIPHINSHYKFNQKNWDKLFNSYTFNRVTFSSIRVANWLLDHINIELARYKYNKDKK